MATRVYSILIFTLYALTLVCYARPPDVTAHYDNNVTNDQVTQCNSCKDVMGFTRRLFDTSDIEELQRNLTEWCVSSGNGATNAVCRNYIVEGMEALNRVGLSYFCERVNVCAESSIPPAQEQIRDSTKCDFCINVVTNLKQIVASTETEQEFKECLGNACLRIGALKDECRELVDKNLDSLFKYLRERMNPRQVCKSTGYCAVSNDTQVNVTPAVSVEDFINLGPVRSFERESEIETVSEQFENVPFVQMQPAQSVTKPDPVKCLMCKRIVTDVMKKIKDNKTEQAIIEKLDGVCARILPEGKQLQKCEQFIQEYTAEVVALIIQQNDPKMICQLLNMCSHKVSDEGQYCDECQAAGHWILQNVTQPNGLTVDDALASVCSEVLPFVRDDCQTFIDRANSSQSLDALIRTHNDSVSLCRATALCSPPPSSREDETERETDQAPPLPSCYICKKIVKWIHQEIRGNNSEIIIENALKRVCKFMKNVDNCDRKVELWSRQIVTALKIGTDPDVICLTLGECGVTEESRENEIESHVEGEGKTERPIETATEPVDGMKSSGLCYECRMIAHFIQQELYDFEKEKRVEDFVISNVCDRAKDPTVKETCESFVTQYGSSVLQLISQKAFDSRVLCQDELRVCAKSSTPSPLVEPKLDIELTNSSSKNQLCSICEESVRELDSVLSSLATSEKQAETVIERVCSRFTDVKRQQCEQIIEAFGAHLQQLIGRLSNANQVCRSIDLCYQVGQVHLLGGHKCSFGPTYWCYTAAHADACRASEFCKTTVWKAVEQTAH